MSASLLRRRAALSLLSATLAFITSAPALAGWPAAVGQDLVISQPAGHGKQIRWLIPDATGGVYVGWLDYAPFISSGELRILRLDANGDVAPGWPASGLVPPRTSLDWTLASFAADGAGGLYGAWPSGTTAFHRLALVHLGPDGALVAGWPASLDLAYGAGYPPNFKDIQIAADAAGVYVSWLQIASTPTVRIQRRLTDGSLAPGWMEPGTTVCPEGTIAMSTDGGSGVFVAWQDSYARVKHWTSGGAPAPGWTTDGVAFPLASPTQPLAMPLALDPDGALFAFGGGFRRIDADGSIPAGWPADGIGLGAYGYFGAMALRPDGGLVFQFDRVSISPPYTTDRRIDALAPGGGHAADWPEGGRSLGSCFAPRSLWSDANGFTMLGWGCGSPVPLQARRFALDGTASTGWSSPTVTLANALAQNLVTIQTRDDLGGTIVGWSNFVSPGTWTTDLRLKRLRDDGVLGAGAVAAVEPARSSALALAAPAPNPAHGPTVLAFDLPRAMRASVALYDLAGRRVRTLVDGHLPAGRSAPRWDGRDDAGRALPAGVYLALLSTDEGNRTRRVALLP